MQDTPAVRILISNDDGVFAPGLQALADALAPLGEVVVVAPDAERSGFSSALTLDRPLRAVQLPNGFWSVNGTPADCVYLALNGLFTQRFDLLVSGINSGANLGDDVMYSGTVGAAREGRLMQLPALAVSFVGQQVRQYQHAADYAVAAQWVYQFVKNGVPALPARHIYNINVPDLPVLRGTQVTRMGMRGQSLPIISLQDPRGRQVYWIGLAGDMALEPLAPHHAPVMSDFDAVAQGFVSITPIQMDVTNHAVATQLATQLNSF